MDMFWCDFMAGWVGGCAGLLVGHPFDTLKVRQQAFNDATLIKVTSDCLKHEGVILLLCYTLHVIVDI